MSSPEAKDRYGRITGIVDVDVLRQKRVTVIGAGSMGQPISNQLVRHGVATQAPGRIRIIDGDTVEARNLIGTDYRQCHLGRPKVDAATSILQEIDPNVNATYWDRCLTEVDLPRIVDMAHHSDLIGLFADSFDLMIEVAERCHGICPMVMAMFAERVDYAEVGVSIPGQTPPLSTTMGKRKRQRIGKPQALGCDTAFVTSFVTALCLRLLLAGAKGTDMLPCFANAPLFLVGLRRTWLFKDQPDDVIRSILCVGSQSSE